MIPNHAIEPSISILPPRFSYTIIRSPLLSYLYRSIAPVSIIIDHCILSLECQIEFVTYGAKINAPDPINEFHSYATLLTPQFIFGLTN